MCENYWHILYTCMCAIFATHLKETFPQGIYSDNDLEIRVL